MTERTSDTDTLQERGEKLASMLEHEAYESLMAKSAYFWHEDKQYASSKAIEFALDKFDLVDRLRARLVDNHEL